MGRFVGFSLFIPAHKLERDIEMALSVRPPIRPSSRIHILEKVC